MGESDGLALGLGEKEEEALRDALNDGLVDAEPDNEGLCDLDALVDAELLALADADAETDAL